MKKLGFCCILITMQLYHLDALIAQTVGRPNILWRNSVTGQNKLWLMNSGDYKSFNSEAGIQTALDGGTQWKICGVGEFGTSASNKTRDNNPDIVWRDQISGANVIWFMNGTNFSSAAQTTPVLDLNWQLIAAADFDRDGYADLLWHNTSTAQNSVWLMQGTNILSYNMIVDNGDPLWDVAGAADFDVSTTSQSYGYLDIVIINHVTGQMGIWFLKGSNGLVFDHGEYMNQTMVDFDYRIVGAYDLNNDGRSDLLLHHTTTGVNGTWYFAGANILRGDYLSHLAATNSGSE